MKQAQGRPARLELHRARVVAAAVVLLYPVDVVFLKHWSPATLLTRGVWALEMLLLTWLWLRADERGRDRLSALNGVLTSVFFLTIVYFTGAADSPYMSLVPSVPLVVALSQPQDSAPTILSGLTCALGILGMLLLGHDSLPHALAWSSLVGGVTFFGVYGAAQFRKLQAAENEARLERARRESMERLARAERHRAQTEKLATVGRLAASVMHEVNNPLAFVRSNLEFLRAEVLAQQLPEEARREFREVFDETRSGVDRIQQIVSDLRGFSRMDVEEPSECTLADVVTDAARLAAVRLKTVARLKVEVPEELPVVFATRRRLAQVLLNLLVNAGDALEEARVRGGEVRVTGRAEPGRVVLLVEDNGPGFAPEALPRLFEAFFTTKSPEKGTGLGLAISRELVEHFGGTLHAENRPEGGARLRLELPAHRP